MTGAWKVYLVLYNLLQWTGWLCALVQCMAWLARKGQLEGIYSEAAMGRTVSMSTVHLLPAAKAHES